MSNAFLTYHVSGESILANVVDAFVTKDSTTIYRGLMQIAQHAHEYNYASGNLWQNYLAYFLLYNENAFSLSCERRKSPTGTLKDLALNDLANIRYFYTFDSTEMELFRNFRGHVDEPSPICDLSRLIANSYTLQEVYEHVTKFYELYGVGALGFNKAFKFNDRKLIHVANENVGDVRLDDIVGYEIQKCELVANTEAFITGKPANNVLLYGDGGTGKSTSVKAILNEYFSRGLRVIELYRHQFKDISRIINTLRRRNYYFIIFIDDLSFEEDESEYKFLKAVIEGGIETKPENVLIYATSNRRHIVREVWKDRDDMEHNGDIHRSDTVEEKLSLSSRFGIALNYSSPTRKMYHEIVLRLAEKSGLECDESKLLAGADTWEIRHGGMTGRTARQYVDYLLGRE